MADKRIGEIEFGVAGRKKAYRIPSTPGYGADEKNDMGMGINAYTKHPYSGDLYSNRGVWDLPNLYQFAPYETGYSFLSVISAPKCMTVGATDGIANYNRLLQDAFVKMLENEFRGLDGIDDITTETVDVTNNISTIQMISKVNQQSNGQISMRFTEKTGSLITKYISTYLKAIRDPRTQAKTYGGYLNALNAHEGNFTNEVFNMLYVITDNTCLNVEKAFLLLNMQPTTAAYSELYNFEKGEIDKKELSIPFNAFVVDGRIPNKIAKAYIRSLINTGTNTRSNRINVNSTNYEWSINGILNGYKHKLTSIDNLKIYNSTNTYSTIGTILSNEE